MPYVLQERRPALDPIVEALVEANLTTEGMTQLLIRIEGYINTLGKIPSEYVPVLAALTIAKAEPNGDLNYVLFKYAKYHIKPSYNNYKGFIGSIHKAMEQVVLKVYIDEYREAAAEIRRRILGPYEDSKIKENGDV